MQKLIGKENKLIKENELQNENGQTLYEQSHEIDVSTNERKAQKLERALTKYSEACTHENIKVSAEPNVNDQTLEDGEALKQEITYLEHKLEIYMQKITGEYTVGAYHIDDLCERIKSDKEYMEIMQRMEEIKRGIVRYELQCTG